MRWLKILGRETWFTLTLLSGKLDERTAEGLNDEVFGFAMLSLTTLASLALLLLGTALMIIFQVG